ncbi:MAG: DUF308 domain-containing protein [Veillonella sp.]|nr:DUF308 domain-containing protein [Veillonella sp.]
MSGSSKFFFILSGIVSIILGIFLLLNPVINLIAFAWLFSIIFFVSAVSSIINYFTLSSELRSGWYLISGIINALFGIYLIFIASGEVFIYFIAFGFLFDGIYSIGEAFKK